MLEPVATQANPPPTLLGRLRELSHPVALVFFVGIRLGLLAMYLLGLLILRNFILAFILTILLLAADFWNVKNVLGRLLVGLRWWNELKEQGGNVWVFETADPNRYINPIDLNVFWILLYGGPVFWVLLAVVAVLKFEFLLLILVAIAVVLNLTNAMAFTKCDKFGKANNVASGMLGLIASQFNPFNRLW